MHLSLLNETFYLQVTILTLEMIKYIELLYLFVFHSVAVY